VANVEKEDHNVEHFKLYIRKDIYTPN